MSSHVYVLTLNKHISTHQHEIISIKNTVCEAFFPIYPLIEILENIP